MNFEERDRRVRLLLGSLYDYLPVVTRGNDSSPGFFTGDRFLLCPDCDFNGFSHRNCESCGGSGRIADGELDPYDTGRDFSWMNVEDERRRNARKRDQLIARLQREALVREGKADLRDRFPWETRRVMMERDGDYRKLRLALMKLSRFCPELHQVVHLVFFSGEFTNDSELTASLAAREGLAVRFLGDQIRGPVRVPEWLDPVTEVRVPSFREMVQKGLSSKQIAFRLNISQRKAKRMLKDLRVTGNPV